MNLEEKQRLLDAQIEPASLTFQLEGLVPTNSLIVRMKAFDEVAPEFFTSGTRLLDIGCAKGYFSLLAAKSGLEVRGIDYNPEAIDLCRILQGSEVKTKFDCISFRNFPLLDTYFDRIFIGNGPHYMFVDSGGNWDWIDKLAILSTDLVLLEGGFDFEDPQMNDLVKVGVDQFNWNCFSKKAQEFFDILKKVPSPIPGRYIVLLKKRTDISTFKEVQLYDLPIEYTFRLGWNIHSTLFLAYFEDELVFGKIYPIGCQPQCLQLASLFEKSSGIKCLIKLGDHYIGCCEKAYLQPEWQLLNDVRKLVKIGCELQIYLARQGHIDIDIALGNKLIFRSGEIRIVDKNQIYPIKGLDERHAKLWVSTLIDSNLCLDSFSIEEIENSIVSNDSHRVELAFKNILNQL